MNWKSHNYLMVWYRYCFQYLDAFLTERLLNSYWINVFNLDFSYWIWPAEIGLFFVEQMPNSQSFLLGWFSFSSLLRRWHCMDSLLASSSLHVLANPELISIKFPVCCAQNHELDGECRRGLGHVKSVALWCSASVLW